MSNVKKLPSADEPTREDKILRGMDAFISAATGAGYAADKFTSYSFSQVYDLDESTLESLYTDHDLAATIVERPVHDALRSGYEINWKGATDAERSDVVDWAESEYAVTEEVKRARIYSRLYGGGGVFVGADGTLEQETIPGGPINFLRATASTELKGKLWHSDPAEQTFGQVAIYELRYAQYRPSVEESTTGPEPVLIHESRVIPFYGVRTTDQQMFRDKGWGKSVLHRVYDVLKKFDSSFDSVLATLAEQSIPVYKVKGLLELLASENGELLAKRFELINTAKGSYRAVILDMEESLERVEASLNQASDVVEAAMLRVSAAGGIPQVLLFGRSASGQNATGASDLENWNQQVRTEQSLTLGPAFRDIYQRLLAQESSPVSGVPEDLTIEFPAVETPSMQDQANLYQQISGADSIYEAMGAVSAAEIALKRSRQSPLFPGVDQSYLQELDDLRKETLLDPPEPMAVPTEEPPAEPEPEEEGEDRQDQLADALSALISGGALVVEVEDND
jgi:phage-related protein (TIGR01555 family)